MAATIAALIVVFIFAYLIKESVNSFTFSNWLLFFTSKSWNPTEGLFAIGPMLVGSFVIGFGAVLVAAPLGILVALYTEFYASPVVSVVIKKTFELASAVPSVVYGFWGLIVLVPIINEFRAPGTSVLAGIIILAMMIFPILVFALLARISIGASYFQSSEALGLSKWTTIGQIILPDSARSIFAGILLQLGRALGETMAIIMVCGNVVQFPTSLFDPVRTLTSNIALEMAYAAGSHRSALFVSSLLLMIFLLLIFVLIQISQRSSNA